MNPRILFLADINSPHAQKWIKGLAMDGFQIDIFSLNNTNNLIAADNINILYQSNKTSKSNFVSKIMYLLVLPRLMYYMIKFKPDVVHAHYATSYGLLASLTTFFTPLFVSVWGSDLLNFPNKSFFHKLILKFVFCRATKICVTSSLLKTEIKKYTSKAPLIIPFGVDFNLFYDFHQKNEPDFTFGCVKYLEKHYNIDKVILAFNMLVKKYKKERVKLLIVGDGTQKSELVALVKYYQLEKMVCFAGSVKHKNIPWYINKLDVLVNVSETESFGVSVAEAMACKTPVIVSNVEGFKDLVPDEKIGLITKSTNAEDVFICMEKYFLNNQLRSEHAEEGYKRVNEFFNWDKNLLEMEALYFEAV